MKAKDLQYEVCLVNLSDKPKWFLELNPKGTVPTYVTGESCLPATTPLTYGTS